MKRFTDTEIWDKEWFMLLRPVHKCLMKYLHDKCDNAGIWSPNWPLASAHISEQVSADDLEGLGDQVELMPNGKVFIPSFIEFQYGELSENCIPHRKVISLLKKHNLFERVYIPYSKGSHTLKEEEEDKEEDKNRKEKGSGGKPSRQANIKPDKKADGQIKVQYAELVSVVRTLADTKEQRKEIGSFIATAMPAFIEPYMDLWNLSVKKYGVSQVENASDGRLKKFKSRIREPAFDFIKILTEINLSDYLQGKKTDWKIDWDWIFENDTNYLKIIEGKYRNTAN